MNVFLKLRHPIRAHNLPKQTLTAKRVSIATQTFT